MQRATVTVRQFILLVGDLCVFVGALALAITLRGLLNNNPISFTNHLGPFSVVFTLWILTFYLCDLYDLRLGANKLTLLRRLSVALLVGGALAAAFFYITPGIAIAPKTTLFLDLLLTGALLTLWRLASASLFSGERFRHRLLFIGMTEELKELAHLLITHPSLGYDVHAVISPEKPAQLSPTVLWAPSLDTLPTILQNERIETVILSMNLHESSELAERLYPHLFLKTQFVDGIHFYESVTRRVPVSAITHAWFLENLHEGGKRIYETTKRGSDLFVSLSLGLLTLLLFPFIAVGIWLTDHGPIFYNHERLGRDGKPFRLYKFRTMVIDAEKAGAQFATAGDLRITPFGKILRMTRLDELPQLWNVLVGEMSLIGPRPERPTIAATLTTTMPSYAMRLLVRPGLTGWAQVNYGYYATAQEHRLKLQYDLYYIKNRSLILDLVILLKTLNTILRARGM